MAQLGTARHRGSGKLGLHAGRDSQPIHGVCSKVGHVSFAGSAPFGNKRADWYAVAEICPRPFAISQKVALVTTSTVWISYDLGVRGDYEGLYAWLDAHDAKECGDSLAVLAYSHDGALLDKLKADIKKHVTIDKRTRIYVVYRDKATGKNKGRFIFGARRAPVWTGYAPSDMATVDEEA